MTDEPPPVELGLRRVDPEEHIDRLLWDVHEVLERLTENMTPDQMWLDATSVLIRVDVYRDERGWSPDGWTPRNAAAGGAPAPEITAAGRRAAPHADEPGGAGSSTPARGVRPPAARARGEAAADAVEVLRLLATTDQAQGVQWPAEHWLARIDRAERGYELTGRVNDVEGSGGWPEGRWTDGPPPGEHGLVPGSGELVGGPRCSCGRQWPCEYADDTAY